MATDNPWYGYRRIAVMCRGVLGPAKPVAEWNEHKIMLAATATEPARAA